MIKKFYGKTKEERKANIREMKLELIEHKKNMEHKLMEEDL